MSKTAVIFDLDGVLVDTAKYHYQAWRKLANELGFEFTELENEQFKGVSRKRCLEILLDIGGVKVSQQEFDRYLVTKNDDYLALIENMNASEILPDVLKVLNFLKDKKIPLALGSASKNAKPILEKVGLIAYFQSIVDGTDVTKAKPNPQVFLLAAEQLEVEPSKCIVFEDSVAGIVAANKASMISIGVGDATTLAAADYNFNDFTEISIAFLENLLTDLEKN